jgi:hypothetical protein
VVHDEVLKAKQFMGKHLPPAAPPSLAESEPVLAMAAMTGTNGMSGERAPHPLHHIQPEVE